MNDDPPVPGTLDCFPSGDVYLTIAAAVCTDPHGGERCCSTFELTSVGLREFQGTRWPLPCDRRTP